MNFNLYEGEESLDNFIGGVPEGIISEEDLKGDDKPTRIAYILGVKSVVHLDDGYGVCFKDSCLKVGLGECMVVSDPEGNESYSLCPNEP